MNIAIVDIKNVIANVIVADESYINDKCKFLSKDSKLWVGDTYTEELALIENFQKELQEENGAEPPRQLIEINITDVQNAKQTNSTFTHVTTVEETLVKAKGTMDIPDKSLTLTFMRNDATKKQYKFGVDVIDGQFEVVLCFKETGQYIFTEDQANLGLNEPMFTINSVIVDVLTKTA